MKFDYLTKYLEEEGITLREAGAACGRSATAIKAWCDGQGLGDKRVRKRIALITGDPQELVDEKVREFTTTLEQSFAESDMQTQTLNDFCKEIERKINSGFVVTNEGTPLSSELKAIIIELVRCIGKFKQN